MEKVDWKQASRWIPVVLPLTVFCLPQFQTTFQEDLILLALTVYLSLRALNDQRLELTEQSHTLLTAMLCAIPYAIGWLGFLRGYGDSLGWLTVLFPMLLLIGIIYRPKVQLCPCGAYPVFLLTIWIVTFFGFMVAGLASLISHTELWQEAPLLDSSIIPSLMVLPVIGCITIIARSMPQMKRGRRHIPLLLILGFTTLSVWGGNFKTWSLWYQAGRLERAWTPFKYDAPQDIARAERKPYQAAYNYNLVYDRLLVKGDIPKFLNWPFFMRYRMAYQAMRKNDPRLCAHALPPAGDYPTKHIDLFKKLWHYEFMWDMPETRPDYAKNSRVWVDAEMDVETKTFYSLDRWGRVYIIHERYLWRDWTPAEDFNDAIDLEIVDGVYVVLRTNGEILTSEPLEILENIAAFPEGHNHTVDIEFLPDNSAAFIINNYGEMIIAGKKPKIFPDSNKLQFKIPAIVDMELEPFGNGYYLLDQYGAVHSNQISGSPSIPHQSPPVAKSLLPYWTNLDMAIDLELDPRGRGLYVYNRLGEIFTIAVSPFFETYRPEKAYPYRGVSLMIDPDAHLFTMESNGKVVEIN